MKNLSKVLIFSLIIAQLGYSQAKDSEIKSKNLKGQAELINFNETEVKVDEKSINQFLKLQFNTMDETYFKIEDKKTIVENNLKSQKFQQFYKGIKVEFGIQNVVSEKDILKTISGKLVDIQYNIEVKPNLSEKEALNFALKEIDAKEYMWENEENENFIKIEKNDKNATYYPKGELIIIEKNLFVKESMPRLAYKFDIYAQNQISRDFIYIDAETGDILLKDPIIKHIQGIGNTRYSGQRNFETQQIGSQYKLRDYSRGQGIETYNMNKGSDYNIATDFVDNDNNWTTTEFNNANKDNAALDAHWGAMKTYDYWLQKHNRNSYDANGAKIRSYVHFSSNYDNAFWDGERMTYGDGGSIFTPLTSIDVVGHEIGHAVCTNTAGLLYQNESGAINEALSDIWGAMIEYFAEPTKQTYLIGEEIKIGGGALRSMSNPKTYSNPNTYYGQYWYTGSGDSGGVHYNSVVFNHWFYILAEGKTGTNDLGNSFSVTGISKDKAAKIVYRAESVYFTATTNYPQARDLTIQAAKDLYGTNSIESVAVCQSWYAVGVGNNNCIVPLNIDGDKIICNATTNYTYTTTNLIPGSVVNWSYSTNALTLVNSTNTSITVKPINSTYSGSATITANVSGNTTTKTIWIGKPSFTVLGSVIVQQPNVVRMGMQSDSNVSLIDQGITSTTWRKFAQNGTSVSCATGYGGVISSVFYLLKVTATNSCGTSEVVYDSETLPIEYSGFLTMTNENLYTVYPNPSKDIVTIEIRDIENQPKKDIKIDGELFDLMGQSILKVEIIDNKATFSVIGLKRGIYVLKIYINDQVEFHQIVVE
ncbi:M4 family metallopeptidase [Flavobacterium sp.]|uniref:M4 family metallopeptidase n=1 Tax=Flavobacterium sp. TaxID=239 RepID=UPI0037C067F5